MRTALYRSYRPARFSEVIGQDSAVAALKNEVGAGRVGHAYIFSGTRGTGKTTLARILARAVNCPNLKDGEPCCECEICRGIDNGSIMDVTEVDAASTSGVDNIRELRDESAYTPAVASMRVYIIDEAHMLSGSAWAALLKIIEDPPEHVMFIFATTEIHKIPATILSRCQRFDLKRITAELIVARLKSVAEQEGIELTDAAARLIAVLADGALRDALSILDTAAAFRERVDDDLVRRIAGITDKSYLFELSDSIESGDAAKVIETVDEMYLNSIEPSRLSFELIKHYRCLFTAKLSANSSLNEFSEAEKQRYIDTSERYSSDRLFEILSSLTALVNALPQSPEKKLPLEIALISLCKTAGGGVPAKPVETKTEKPRESAPSPQPAPQQSAEAPKPSEAPKTKETSESKSAPKSEQLSEGSFEAWDEIVEQMETENRLLWGFMKGSKAYLSGGRVLIDASDLFMKYMREHSDSNELLKSIIERVTGKRLPIGPYEKKSEPAKPEETANIDSFLERARDLGMQVESN